MAVAIWIAARVDNAFDYVSSRPFLWVFFGLVAASVISSIIRLARRASMADIYPSPIIDAWFLVRFTIIPASFLLALSWLVASAIGLGFAGTLGEASLLTLMPGVTAILITSVLADVAAAIKGPGRGSPSES